jgi:Brp/Blh family beta-carotene 15,15'-monooxygenase
VLNSVNKIFVMCTLSLPITYTLILYKAYKNRFYRITSLAFALQTTILLGLIYFLPFYLGFAFYFGIWHSFLSFEIIMEHLSLQQNKSGWKTLALKAFPYCILAWFGIALVIYIGSSSYQLNELIAGLFIGISILTLPHLNVFSKALQGNKNSKHSLD